MHPSYVSLTLIVTTPVTQHPLHLCAHLNKTRELNKYARQDYFYDSTRLDLPLALSLSIALSATRKTDSKADPVYMVKFEKKQKNGQPIAAFLGTICTAITTSTHSSTHTTPVALTLQVYPPPHLLSSLHCFALERSP